MSLLTPLYLASLAVVALPVLFHLIRRMPRGRVPFSSLMFLSSSPPRLTRKSRLENVLLLLLRALALVVLAIAFARPFLRELAQVATGEERGRHVALLLDTSASMRRENLWEQAVEKAESALGDVGPGDDVALFTFNKGVEVLVPFNDVMPADPAPQLARVRARLAQTAPTWAESNLGAALIAVADELNDAGDRARGTAREIVLISDLAGGSRLDSLGGYAWPEDVRLILQSVASAAPTNAGLDLAGAGDDDGDRAVRVRVTNDGESNREEFELTWTAADGAAIGKAMSAYVPPGQSRVFRIPRPAGPAAAHRLLLTGDDHDFDNALAVVEIRQEDVPVIFIGSDGAGDAAGLRYYLERALPETARRKVRLIPYAPGEPLRAADVRAARLTVVGDAVPEERSEELRTFMAGGGTVLYVLKDLAAGAALGRLMNRDVPAIEEARPAGGYAMLGEILFTHPIFAPFNDPRFNDFTKIHFWKYRRVHIEGIPQVTVLARFDSGDPALFEQAQARGRLLVLASGWHPADSELARSSKFVPLIASVLERSGVSDAGLPQYRVGDMVGRAPADPAGGTVRMPDGSEVELDAGARMFAGTDVPGVYELRLDAARRLFAVNVDISESTTAPRDRADLERFGLLLGREPPPSAAQEEKQRQLHEAELENTQKLWRWLIVTALGILFIETVLAGYGARAPAGQPEVTT